VNYRAYRKSDRWIDFDEMGIDLMGRTAPLLWSVPTATLWHFDAVAGAVHPIRSIATLAGFAKSYRLRSKVWDNKG